MIDSDASEPELDRFPTFSFGMKQQLTNTIVDKDGTQSRDTPLFKNLIANIGECAAVFETKRESPLLNFIWCNAAFETQFELNNSS